MEENDQLRFEGFNLINKKLGTKRGLITDALTKDKLIDLYYHQHKSLQDIAKEFNCTRQMVKLLMEGYGLQRRKRSEARVLAIKEGKFEGFEHDDINENFFSVWTPQMAWVLGLLFTDGYIVEDGGGLRAASSLRVSLSSIDGDMLENVRRHLKSTRPIQKKVQSYDRTKHIYSFEFYREKIREDLFKLGLRQRKSLNMEFPKVPEEYMRHFIRGCWDGDGTAYIDKNRKLNASYVSGAKGFMEQLVEELYRIEIYRKTIHYPYSEGKLEVKRLRSTYPLGKYPLKIHVDHRSMSPSYSIKIRSKENVEKLFYYFYKDVDESMYLKRKYDVFVKGLKLTEEEQVLQKENKFGHTPIPIQPFSIDHQPKISRKIQNVIWSIKARTNKKVLIIKNIDGRLKCFKCGKVSETIYLISQPYCPNCLANSNL